jgi:type I restriction enzyme, S subunit
MKWPLVPLDTITVTIRNGLNIRQYSIANGLPITRIETISEQTINPQRVGYGGIKDSEKKEWYLEKGDILFSHINSEERIGNCAMYDGIPKPLVHGMNLLCLRPNIQLINPKFLLYSLKSAFFRIKLKSIIKRAVNQASISIGNLKEIKISLPPISEQLRIVEIVEQAERLRKMRTEADKKAERILPGLFIKMFGDPATNPKGCPVVPISEMVMAPERTNPGQYPDKPFKYIDIAGVDGHTGVITEVKSLVGAEAPSRARQVVVENDVIVSTVRPYLRATAIVPKEYNNQICSTGFCVLRARAGIGFGFLYALTRLQWFTDQLNSRARGASYPAVSDQDILSLRVPVPNDENIMKKFDLCLLDILSLNDKKATSFKKISCLFDIILCRAFSGDLTASWRQAHMKELLQEMEIQAKVLAS